MTVMTEGKGATTDQIKTLAIDVGGEYIQAFLEIRSRHPGIRTSRPDDCAEEAERRGLGPVSIYMAGQHSVVCFGRFGTEGKGKT